MRESLLVRIACDPPARVSSCVGDLAIPADNVEDEDGATYLGGGELISFPDFQQIINGTAERIEVQVSGVTGETLRLALEDAPSVKGARVDVGTIRFNDEWQPLGPVTWESRYRADTLSVSSQSGQDGRTRTISLSVATEDTNRSRAPLAFFTDADQRRRSSDDAFFSHVAGITAGTSRRFGPQ